MEMVWVSKKLQQEEAEHHGDHVGTNTRGQGKDGAEPQVGSH